MSKIADRMGKNLGDVQQMNRTLVLRTLREKGTCSRAEIAKATQLQQTTITNIINTFLEYGVVSETGLLKGSRGRRSIGIAMNSDRYYVISVRLTRKFILGGLYDISGECRALQQRDIDASDGVEAAIDTMKALIDTLIGLSKQNSILGIGIGLPGPFLRNVGRIALIPDFSGWEEISLRERLEPLYNIPVYQEFDAYACALAEWWFGGHDTSKRLSLLSLSMEQGLGAALVIEGHIYYGSQGIAGSIGHTSIDYQGEPCECGSRGCLRNYCTAKAVLRRAAELSIAPNPPGTPLTLQALLDMAVIGDAQCRLLIKEAATYLGYGLVNAVNMYNPDIIVLSDEFRPVGELYLDTIREVFAERLLPAIRENVHLQFTTLTSDPVLMGMTAVAIDSVFENPDEFAQFSQAHANRD